jgi:hypothetical protein
VQHLDDPEARLTKTRGQSPSFFQSVLLSILSAVNTVNPVNTVNTVPMLPSPGCIGENPGSVPGFFPMHTNIRGYRTIHNRLAPLRPQSFGWGRRGGGDEGPTARKAVWLFG